MIRRLAALALCVALLVLHAQPGEAQIGLGCSVEATPIAFGTYDVFAASPAVGSGTVTVRCLVGLAITIALTTGGSGSYTPRQLRSGAHALDYNLYVDPAGTTTWGDGTGGTIAPFLLLQALVPVVRTVHARIPPGQDAATGTYSDNVIATIVF